MQVRRRAKRRPERRTSMSSLLSIYIEWRLRPVLSRRTSCRIPHIVRSYPVQRPALSRNHPALSRDRPVVSRKRKRHLPVLSRNDDRAPTTDYSCTPLCFAERVLPLLVPKPLLEGIVNAGSSVPLVMHSFHFEPSLLSLWTSKLLTSSGAACLISDIAFMMSAGKRRWRP